MKVKTKEQITVGYFTYPPGEVIELADDLPELKTILESGMVEKVKSVGRPKKYE